MTKLYHPLLAVALLLSACQPATTFPPNDGNLQFQCYGTEPFWILDFVGSEVWLKDINNNPKAKSGSFTQVKTEAGWSFTTSHGFEGDVEFIDSNGLQCSDGMSDRLADYKLNLTSHPYSPKLGSLHGCCRIVPTE